MPRRKPTAGKSSGCGGRYSPWHDEEGRFTNPDEVPEGSWSCKDKKQKSRRGRSTRFTKTPCGRKARAKGKNVRCHDGAVMGEELLGMIRTIVEEKLGAPRRSKAKEEQYVTLHLPTLRTEFARQVSRGSGDGLVEEADCSKCIQNYLRSLNAAINASKGDLGKK